MEIAQITFSKLTSPPKQNYKKTGRFAKDNWSHFVQARPRPAQAKKRSAQTTKRK
jgi:hypothetical protein